jgi:hypothetical protein
MVLEPVVEMFGPFLIPVVVFIAGVSGYGLLRALNRAGLFDGDGDQESSEPPPE